MAIRCLSARFKCHRNIKLMCVKCVSQAKNAPKLVLPSTLMGELTTLPRLECPLLFPSSLTSLASWLWGFRRLDFRRYAAVDWQYRHFCFFLYKLSPIKSWRMKCRLNVKLVYHAFLNCHNILRKNDYINSCMTARWSLRCVSKKRHHAYILHKLWNLLCDLLLDVQLVVYLLVCWFVDFLRSFLCSVLCNKSTTDRSKWNLGTDTGPTLTKRFEVWWNT